MCRGEREAEEQRRRGVEGKGRRIFHFPFSIFYFLFFICLLKKESFSGELPTLEWQIKQ
jgi:hypothetical protein